MHETVGREDEWPLGDPTVDLSYEREGAGKIWRRLEKNKNGSTILCPVIFCALQRYPLRQAVV